MVEGVRRPWRRNHSKASCTCLTNLARGRFVVLDRSPVQVGLSRGTPFVEVHATVCRVGENQPSEYELRAWTDLHRPRQARIMTRAAQAAAERVSARTHVLGELAAVKRATNRASELVSVARERMPAAAAKASGKGRVVVNQVAQGGVRAVSRFSTAALSPDRIIRAHVRAGHDVASLGHIRRLDLERVDGVRPRGLDLMYASVGAVSGAGAGVGITALGLSGPAAAGIAGVMVADAGVVLGLASAVVGHTAMYYGYDATRPEEKAFVLSVVDFGTSLTAAGKTAAFHDIAKLTHALRVQKSWAKLNESVVSRVVTRFVAKLGPEMTKKQLAKAVPFVSAAVGMSMNWVTIEMIADAADLAYRRRWLLDKYPHLATEQPEPMLAVFDYDQGAADNLGVVDILREEGIDIQDDETRHKEVATRQTAPGSRGRQP